ncbi:MAG: ATP-dependent 6-phosphofructokinase [Verrucomicrobiota bacterium]
MENRFKVDTLGECTVDTPLAAPTFIEAEDGVLVDPTLRGQCSKEGKNPDFLEQAGPRRKIFFNPQDTTAAIVSCGGLCPGINDTIRGITMILWHRYGVRNILGLKYGYEGLVPSMHEPLELTPEVVEDIHKDGGTVLGTSRGPQDVNKMVDFLCDKKIDILFTIGGDGTQRGAETISAEISRRDLKIAVVGIPKTIDNDIVFTERSFGFETAVAMSMDPIQGAHREAQAAMNGIGLVKLMGRHSGFIAAYATLASSDVNMTLVPEVKFTMEKTFLFLTQRLKQKSHAVIVVAEGAGQDLVSSPGKDASGNRKPGDIGQFLKNRITDHFTSSGIPVTVKYIDPSYTIRSAPASADDSAYCFRLAQNAVHAGMAGRTTTLIGQWNSHFVHVPMRVVSNNRKTIDPSADLWQSVLDNTGQPWKLD